MQEFRILSFRLVSLSADQAKEWKYFSTTLFSMINFFIVNC
jgi:hypothetical protein